MSRASSSDPRLAAERAKRAKLRAAQYEAALKLQLSGALGRHALIEILELLRHGADALDEPLIGDCRVIVLANQSVARKLERDCRRFDLRGWRLLEDERALLNELPDPKPNQETDDDDSNE